MLGNQLAQAGQERATYADRDRVAKATETMTLQCALELASSQLVDAHTFAGQIEDSLGGSVPRATPPDAVASQAPIEILARQVMEMAAAMRERMIGIRDRLR